MLNIFLYYYMYLYYSSLKQILAEFLLRKNALSPIPFVLQLICGICYAIELQLNIL